MPVSLKQIEPRRLYQQIADQIRELIGQGGFDTGTRLPAERELAQQLGVSRPSLREALIALDVEGTVEIRSGSGVYVCRPVAPTDKASASLGDSPTELMQARSAIEGSVAALVCARVDSVSISRLQETINGMRQKIARRSSPLEFDRQFHVALAEMSGNLVMVRLVTELFERRQSQLSAESSARGDNSRNWNQVLKEHEAILRALELRDPLAAQAAMRCHLKASEERSVGE